MSEPTRVLADLAAPPQAPNRRCGRCEAIAAHARKAHLPAPPVREVESWVRLSVRYFGGLCADCADWEWSAHWNARHEQAFDDPLERQRLERERDRRVARGRRFWKSARFEVAPKR